VKLRAFGFLMVFILAGGAPLQALAAAASAPCRDTHPPASHHHGEASGHESHADAPQPAGSQKAHVCGSCMACCAGAAISFYQPLSLPDSASEPATAPAAASPSASPPARLDRPPQQ